MAPTSKTGALFVLGERSVPHGIIVDAQGRRFANESESYVDLGHHMLEHDKDGDFWLVTDKIHALKYLRNYMLDPSGAKGLKAEGVLHKEDTIEELAVSIGADPAVLRETVERFNGFAHAGVDGDFGRGNSAYDRYYSDPNVHPKPEPGHGGEEALLRGEAGHRRPRHQGWCGL